MEGLFVDVYKVLAHDNQYIVLCRRIYDQQFRQRRLAGGPGPTATVVLSDINDAADEASDLGADNSEH